MNKQEPLPGMQLSEEDIVNQAMAMPLEAKIKKAVGLLRSFEPMALRARDDGYWLAYSGGKDSDCILELAKMAGVKYKPVYNVTTIDPPELVRYIKREHPEVEFNRPEMHMLTMLWRDSGCKGPPNRLARWCCDKYKEHGGDGYSKIIGVRAAESPRRKAMWNSVMHQRGGQNIICPIVYWTDNDVWAFHKLRNLKYCELYDEGFKRLGCIGCPLAGPQNMCKEFARWPKYEKLWKRAFKRFWDRWHGVPTRTGGRRWFEDFGSAENLWDWWVSGKAKDDGDDDCQMQFMFI